MSVWRGAVFSASSLRRARASLPVSQWISASSLQGVICVGWAIRGEKWSKKEDA